MSVRRYERGVYEVTNKAKGHTYLVRFNRANGNTFGKCTCEAGTPNRERRTVVCKHLFVAVDVHNANNAARQPALGERGTTLAAELADRITEHLRAAQRLLARRPAPTPPPQTKEAPRIQTGTARYRLWERSPFCFWCGRPTRIEAFHEDDAATLDHLHPSWRAASATESAASRDPGG